MTLTICHEDKPWLVCCCVVTIINGLLPLMTFFAFYSATLKETWNHFTPTQRNFKPCFSFRNLGRLHIVPRDKRPNTLSFSLTFLLLDSYRVELWPSQTLHNSRKNWKGREMKKFLMQLILRRAFLDMSYINFHRYYFRLIITSSITLFSERSF